MASPQPPLTPRQRALRDAWLAAVSPARDGELDLPPFPDPETDVEGEYAPDELLPEDYVPGEEPLPEAGDRGVLAAAVVTAVLGVLRQRLDALGGAAADGTPLAAAYGDALAAGGDAGDAQLGAAGLELRSGFDRTDPGVLAWARDRAGSLIAGATEDVLAGVRDLVTQAVSGDLAGALGPAGRLEELLGATIGLAPRDVAAVAGLYRRELDAGRSAGLAAAAAQRYGDEKLRQRAETIARTEVLTAENRGKLESYNQAEERGFLPPDWVKVWVTGPDPCPECVDLDGEEAALDEPFSDGEDCPPDHPRCRCSFVVSPPSEVDSLDTSNPGDGEDAVDAVPPELEADSGEETDFSGREDLTKGEDQPRDDHGRFTSRLGSFDGITTGASNLKYGIQSWVGSGTVAENFDQNLRDMMDPVSSLSRVYAGGLTRMQAEDKAALAFLRAVKDAPAVDQPVYRGLTLPTVPGVGETVDTGLTSFSLDRGVAEGFTFANLKNGVPVLFQVQPGLRGLDISRKAGKYNWQREVVTGGRFVVDRVETGHASRGTWGGETKTQPVTIVHLHQVEAFGKSVQAIQFFPFSKYSLDTEVTKYSPDQPRVPAGSPEGGEWGAEGEDGVVGNKATARREPARRPSAPSVATAPTAANTMPSTLRDRLAASGPAPETKDQVVRQLVQALDPAVFTPAVLGTTADQLTHDSAWGKNGYGYGYLYQGAATSDEDMQLFGLVRGDDPRVAASLQYVAVNQVLATWAATSNDSDVEALALQGAAEREFGVLGTAEWDIGSRTLSSIDARLSTHGAFYQAVLRAQYDSTQALFREAGVTEVVVYRGYQFDEGFPTWAAAAGAVGEAEVPLRPLSSVSFSQGTARMFGGGRNGIVTTATVPISRILSTAATGVGCLGESEMVLLTGPGTWDVRRSYIPRS